MWHWIYSSLPLLECHVLVVFPYKLGITVKLGYNDHGYNDHGYNDHGYNDHGYNDHGYNEFTFITNKILPNFWSKMTSYYLNVHGYV